MEINFFCKYADLMGKTKRTYLLHQRIRCPQNSFQYYSDNRKNSDDNHLPSDDSNDDSEVVIPSDNTEPEEPEQTMILVRF